MANVLLMFGKYLYLVDHDFNSEKMKTENQITATALIRKDKILGLGGYGLAKRYVNEDWHLWLRMLANNEFPIQISYYGFWYRRRNESLLSDINDEKKEENKLRLQDLKDEAKDEATTLVNIPRYLNVTLKEAGEESYLIGEVIKGNKEIIMI